jgi:hypothetical protein
MKLWKRLNNRSRILVLLLGSLVLLNLIVLATTFSLKSFSGSFASMLNDRLIPSAEIAQLQEYAYKNRLYLEDYIFHDSRKNIPGEIKKNNALLDSTFTQYKHSYFTEEENVHAGEFMNALSLYRQYEEKVLVLLARGEKEEAEKLYEGAGEKAFQLMINELHLLAGIQLTVGRGLYEQADSTISILKMVAYFSLVVSLVIAVQLLKVLGIRPR